MNGLKIAPARSADDIAAVGALFLAYAQFLQDDHGIDLAFQNFAAELASLPGNYGLPKGEMLLARRSDGTPVGCIAMRPHDAESCEIKRLYVVPAARRQALGQGLVEALIAAARARGYRRMILDTAEFLDVAISLYEGFDFIDIPPYNDSPVPGMRYMALTL